MTLNITDPAIMFSGISLLFLAYTNRYLALANVIRTLNRDIKSQDKKNHIAQLQNLHTRTNLIKYMQAMGVISFLFCIASMIMLYWQFQHFGEISFIFSLMLYWQFQHFGEISFIFSLIAMVISLIISLVEILISGGSLKMELERTNVRDLWDK